MTNGSAGLRVFALAGRDVARVRFASPWLTWGAVAGTKAGELLQVEYSVNRPLLARATIKLADGRELAMTVTADHLEVLLPPDTPDGLATIAAELEAANGDRATATLDVLLVGVLQARPGGMPRPAPRALRPHRLVTAPARARVITRPDSVSRREPRTAVGLRVRPTRRHAIPAPLDRGTSTPVRVRVHASAHVDGLRRDAASALHPAVGATAVTRRDGRELEEALLFDLL